MLADEGPARSLCVIALRHERLGIFRTPPPYVACEWRLAVGVLILVGYSAHSDHGAGGSIGNGPSYHAFILPNQVLTRMSALCCGMLFQFMHNSFGTACLVTY